jgi:hypothetical protein
MKQIVMMLNCQVCQDVKIIKVIKEFLLKQLHKDIGKDIQSIHYRLSITNATNYTKAYNMFREIFSQRQQQQISFPIFWTNQPIE